MGSFAKYGFEKASLLGQFCVTALIAWFQNLNKVGFAGATEPEGHHRKRSQ